MKHLVFPAMIAAMLAGCVESDEPLESTDTSAVTVGDFNYVHPHTLFLRSSNSPTGTVIGQMACGVKTYVDFVDWNTRMARLPNMGGWALADGSTGPNLSVTRPGCI
jgi:hypothetical protein